MMSHWMFSCREVSQRVSRSFEQDLPWMQRLLVRLHLKMCRYCARFAHQLALLRRIVQQTEWVDNLSESETGLPDDARDRIKRALQSA